MEGDEKKRQGGKEGEDKADSLAGRAPVVLKVFSSANPLLERGLKGGRRNKREK